MPHAIAVELVKTLPAVLWVGFATLVYLTLRRAIVPQMARLSSVKAPMLEIGFAEELLDQAAAKTETGSPPSASERRAAVSRLEHAAPMLRGRRILWVDDNPGRVQALTRLFRDLGMTVDMRTSTDEAIAQLQERSYDLIISDMRRGTEQPAETAGISLLDSLERRRVRLPVVIFAAVFDPSRGVHRGIFAYTNAPDELVQYVIDVMERVSFGIT